MSVALYLELVNYEGKNVYQDVLLEHIDDVQSLLKRCESLKNYDINLTKSMIQMIEELISDTKNDSPQSFSPIIHNQNSYKNFQA